MSVTDLRKVVAPSMMIGAHAMMSPSESTIATVLPTTLGKK